MNKIGYQVHIAVKVIDSLVFFTFFHKTSLIMLCQRGRVCPQENQFNLQGAFHSTKSSRTSKRGQMVRKRLWKVSKQSEIFCFSNCEPFNRKIRKKERKFLETNSRKFGYTVRGFPLSGNFGKCCSIRHQNFTEIQTVFACLCHYVNCSKESIASKSCFSMSFEAGE